MDFTRGSTVCDASWPRGITKSEDDPFKRQRDRVETMLDTLCTTAIDPALATALARAAGAIVRLDQVLAAHPLRLAFLYRARLDAVRHQADADGQRIDPWHLAALHEGLRLRMDPWLRIVERGETFEAARYALALHRWLAAPDFDQEGEVQLAEQALAAAVPGTTPLLAAAHGMHTWLAAAGTRPPIRAALIRFLGPAETAAGPGPADRRPGAARRYARGPRMLGDGFPDRAHRRGRGRAAVAAGPGAHLVRGKGAGGRTAAPLARGPAGLRHLPRRRPRHGGQQRGRAARRFRTADIAVEVTHRSKRRLFGLVTLAPLRQHVAPPYHPEPGRDRGRPPPIPQVDLVTEPPPLPPLTQIERLAFDYSDIEHWMARERGDHAQSFRAPRPVRGTLRVLSTVASPKFRAITSGDLSRLRLRRQERSAAPSPGTFRMGGASNGNAGMAAIGAQSIPGPFVG